jgi:7-cyano-7-deazaguanine reductase
VDDSTDGLTILGETVREPRRTIESFPAPPDCTEVTFHTEELTSLCPVTGQPDHGSLTLTYRPSARCIESKSWKLYLWSFRDERQFVEQLAHRVAHDVADAVAPEWVEVTVRQNVRGGIETTARAELGERWPMQELELLDELTVDVEVPEWVHGRDALTGDGAPRDAL